MASKAERLRNKRIKQAIRGGRPRKEGERQPNGRLKPSETQKEVRRVAIEAIERVHGIKTDGNDQRAGYTLGRMNMDGRISKAELEAGDWYTEQMARYYSMTGIPFPSARAQDLFRVKGMSGEESQSRVEAIRRATNMFMKIEGILLRCADGPQVKSTVFNVCLRDIEELRMMPEHQLSWLKRGLREVMILRGVANMAEAG